MQEKSLGFCFSCTVLIAVALWRDVEVTIAITAGLAAFGVVFAMNSSIHSYKVLAFTEQEDVSINVGFC